MKIIHTSDWHLGNRLMDHSRMEEFKQFLEFMLHTLEQEKPDALLVSGDIFDNTTPSEGVREMYCDFLSRAHGAGCGQVVITAGNHDGVTQLGVERPLLKRHHCHLVTSLRQENAADCLVELKDAAGTPQALVCAVPFLRVAEVSLRADADDEAGRSTSYVRGVAAVYARVAELAAEWKAAHPQCPVLAMGHLLLGGAETTPSTRNLTIGNVEAVGRDVFSPVFDYVALGHIHRGYGDDRIRYCGSPLPMGMDEAAAPHRLLVWEDGAVRELPVPEFTLFRSVSCCGKEELGKTLDGLAAEAERTGKPVWLQLEYAGGDMTPQEVRDTAARREKHIPVCLVRKTGIHATAAALMGRQESLHQLGPQVVFNARLDEYTQTHPMTDTDREELTKRFHDILSTVLSNKH